MLDVGLFNIKTLKHPVNLNEKVNNKSTLYRRNKQYCYRDEVQLSDTASRLQTRLSPQIDCRRLIHSFNRMVRERTLFPHKKKSIKKLTSLLQKSCRGHLIPAGTSVRPRPVFKHHSHEMLLYTA